MDGIIEMLEQDAGADAVVVVGGAVAVAVAIFCAINTAITGAICGICWESETNSLGGSWHYQGKSADL